MDDYGRRVILDMPFERAVGATSNAFLSEGFDLVSTLDIQNYLTHNAHHDCRRYVLLTALLPQLTLEALQHGPEIGAVLPTVIAIYELPDGETAVAASPALAPVISDLGWRAGRPALAALADRAAERLARALDRLQHVRLRSTTLA